MKPKTTDDLCRELFESNNIDDYIKENQALFSHTSAAEALANLCKKHPISKIALARRAGMSEVYLHQVLSSRRNPSRDRLLCLCLGMEATLDEAQALLRQSGYAQLDPKIQRDAIISYGILHRMELAEINDKLFDKNEKTLF